MKSFKSLKFLFVMLFVFVSIACNGAVVDKISAQTINSSNSIVITNKALLGEQVVLTSQQDKLYLHIVNTATDEKREITLVRYNSVVSNNGSIQTISYQYSKSHAFLTVVFAVCATVDAGIALAAAFVFTDCVDECFRVSIN